jgi:hypothetical protein
MSDSQAVQGQKYQKLFGSGQNFEAKRELLRPGFGQRSHFG